MKNFTHDELRTISDAVRNHAQYIGGELNRLKETEVENMYIPYLEGRFNELCDLIVKIDNEINK